MGDHDVRDALRRSDLAAAHRLLVQEHYRAVFDRCHAIARARAVAEDAAQTTFLKVLEHPDPLASVVSYRGWLLSVATTTTLDALRTSQRHHDRVTRARQHGVLEDSVVTVPQAASDERKVAAAIDECLAALEPETRAAFLRRVKDDAPWADIARELGLAVDTIRMRVRRAELDMRTQLAARGIEP